MALHGPGPPPNNLTYEVIKRRLTQACHDLNNPLAVISGNAQLFLAIAEAGTIDSELLDSVKDIDTAARRLASLVDDIRQLRDEIDETMREGLN